MTRKIRNGLSAGVLVLTLSGAATIPVAAQQECAGDAIHMLENSNGTMKFLQASGGAVRECMKYSSSERFYCTEWQ